MSRTNKATATRILNVACRRAIALIRAGQTFDAVVVLNAAGLTAETLMEET